MKTNRYIVIALLLSIFVSSFEDGFLRKSYFAYMSFLLWVNVAKTPFNRHFNDCSAVR